MVNELYFRHQISKSKIARELKISRNFVARWTQSEDQDFTVDNRGWEKGKARKWDIEIKERIKAIRFYLENDSFEFYIGATAIKQEWRRRYADEVSPLLRTRGKYLSDLGLAQKRKIKHKGAAKYLCYPEHTIYNQLGDRVAEVDFIGKKYIHGSSEPLNFIGFSFKKEPRLRYYKRIEGHFVSCFIAFLLERELELCLRRRNVDFSAERIKEALNRMEFSEIEIEGQKYFLKGKHNSLASKIFAVLKIKQPANLMSNEQTTEYMEKFKN